MSTVVDMVGERIGRLVVVARAESRGGRAAWLCRCDCGTQKVIAGHGLRSATRSCGCLHREAFRTVTHGGTGTPEYEVWAHMISRCENPKSAHFDRYGGRGISVQPRWRSSFESFLSDMGPKPSPEYTIERINNDGDYEPGNCRWATVSEQARNKSNNRMLSAFGETLCLAQWAARLSISPCSLADRIDRGWPIERALSQPGRKGRYGKLSVSYKPVTT